MKRRTAIALGAGLPAAAGLFYAQRRGVFPFSDSSLPLAGTEGEKRILGVIAEALRKGEVHLEVPVSDGRMLRLLTELAGATNVVEVGTSTGFSGLWLLLALHKTKGKLTTFEIDPGRAAMARRHFQQAGVADLVTVVEGDAGINIRRLKDPIDVLFLDADRGAYLDYFSHLLPLLRPGGLLLTHNFSDSAAYAKALLENPNFETLVPRGSLSITLKKRTPSL